MHIIPSLLAVSVIASLAACNQQPSAAAASGVVAAASGAPVVEGKTATIDAESFPRLLGAKHGIVLDVRTPGEVARGRLPGRFMARPADHSHGD